MSYFIIFPKHVFRFLLVPKLINHVSGGGARERYLRIGKIRPKFLQKPVSEALLLSYFAKLVAAVLSTTKGFPNLEEAEQLIFPEMTFTELYCRIHRI